MNFDKDLSIIIVNWNTGALLTQCVDSIKNTVKGIDYEIIVTDNASTDDSIARLEKTHNNVEIIKSEKNLGFAAGNNLALSRCKGKNIMLLNPDTLLTEGAVDKMTDYLENHSGTGVVGPSLTDEKGNIHPSTAGSFPELFVIFCEVSGLTKLFPSSSRIRGLYMRSKKQKPLEVDWVSGACIMLRHKVFDKTGPLNESFFLYFEDQEWCYRIKKKGYKIIFLPQAKVIHFENQSVLKVGEKAEKKNRLSYRDYLLNFNSPSGAFIAEKLYFSGLLSRYTLARLKYLIYKDEKSKTRLTALKKFINTVRS